MLRVDAIADLETAKQVAVLLEKENARLHARLKALLTEIAQLRGEDGPKQLQLEIVKLQEQMASLQHRLYGASSEKRPHKDSSTDAPTKPQTGHGPRERPALPVVVVEHALDESERSCELCDKPLIEWKGQSEDSDEVDVVERHFVIKRHKRMKYRCTCTAAPKTASAPLKLIVGGRYAIDFAVEVATSKYLDHAPLERQARIMRREGLVVDSQTLWDQIELLARHLEPSYDALLPYLHKEETLHADETPWYLLKGKPAERWYVWMIASTAAAYYHFDPTRSTAAAHKILDDYRALMPLHNNLAERELRSVVVGRKNHYGSKSQRGTEVAAIFYSLLQSAYLCGVDPKGVSRRGHAPRDPRPRHRHTAERLH